MGTTTFGESTLDARRPYVDPKQVRFDQLARQQREIVAEMRALRAELSHGICEQCGKGFVRVRVTRRYCSQRCLGSAFVARERKNGVFSLDTVVEALPLLKAGRLMTPRNFEIIETAIALHGNAFATAEHVGGVSRQRISQVLAKATKLGRAVLLMKAALRTEHT